ncbi:MULTISPECIES: hypothetical protein [Clostridia]|uniref:hypothetical protein n=1 Tax=Clostridia TaxID=186801 RepID=UPI000EA3BB38|nr:MULTISPECIES: hypothetical protein [Clostridia]NBJ68896.1 hypothetical protein [Roseburia sp. 1XD42-34]RKI80269.1 hypothetical protein D7V87_05310 [Clostridium sp. 1xD42-85]
MKVKEINNAILKSSNKEIKEFVNKHFGKNQSASDIMNHFNTLKKLKGDILILGIARMDQIETDYDISKSFPSLLAIVVLMFGIYGKIFNKVIVFVLATILSISLLVKMKKERRIRATAVYFRSLLIQIKQINESKKHS